MSKLSVYIVCPVRSGSTLLNMLLGSVDGFAAAGESFRLNSCIGHTDRLCTCGEPVVNCAYWTPVEEKLRAWGALAQNQNVHDLVVSEPVALSKYAKEAAKIGVINPGRSIVKEMALVLGSRTIAKSLSLVCPSLRLSRQVCLNVHLLYDAIREVHKNRVVIDSSKNVGRMKGIYMERPEETRVIYLIRDGRASCFSMMRAENEPMDVCVREWRREHRRISLALMSIPSRRILKVHYEDLCSNVDEQLKRIVKWLGQKYQRTGSFRNQSHNIGGNPMRMRKQEDTVKLDASWRTELNDSDLAVFERNAGKLNRKLGYCV